MKPFFKGAIACALLALVQVAFQPAAHGAPGDFLYKWGATSTFRIPYAIARDQGGNIYVTEIYGEQSIDVYDSSGKFLRKWGSYGTGNGQFRYPYGVAVAPNGRVYVADSWNNRIQVFDNQGNFLTKWGTFGTGDGQFDMPMAVALDATGNVYVVDHGNHRVEVFDATGRFLRKWGSSGSSDGQLYYPTAVAIDATGSVYVADRGNSRIEVFDTVGNFIRKWNSYAAALAIDGSGHILAVDDPSDAVTTYSNTGTVLAQWGGYGQKDGQLFEPTGAVVQNNGNVYVVDSGNSRIQIFSPTGAFLSKWWYYGGEDGEFDMPMQTALDSSGNLYVADYNNHRVEVFTSTGTFLRKWAVFGTDPRFVSPRGIAIDSAQNVYVSDVYGATIGVYDLFGNFLRQWSAGGNYTSPNDLAVDPQNRLYAATYDSVQIFDSSGTELGQWYPPKFATANSIAADTTGHIYVSDSGNRRIAVFDAAQNLLRTIGEGQFATYAPGAIGVDLNGNVFVANSNDEIVVFDANGTLRGRWGGHGTADGLFDRITGITIDKTGSLVFVSDSLNNRIQVLAGFGDQIPNGWLTRDIGSVGVPGRASYRQGTFTLAGSGADIWGTADGFRYVYQSLSGDGQIVARVATLQNTHPYAKGGVMIRETLAANSRHAMVDITPGSGAEFSRRTATGGSTDVTGLGGAAAPYWVKLVRQGNTFSGYVSNDGATWSLIGTSTITMGNSVYIGLLVSSHNNSVLCSTAIDGVSLKGQVSIPTVTITAPEAGTTYSAPASIRVAAAATAGSGAAVKQVNFYAGTVLIGTATTAPYQTAWDNVAAGDYSLTAQVIDTLGGTVTSTPIKVSVINTTLPPPWATADVGMVGLAGSAGLASGVFTIRGAGADIWGTADAFRFVYQNLSGDGQIVARISSLQNTNGYAKAAVMIRESLAANSAHAMMALTPSSGAEFSRRTPTGGSTTVTALGGVAAPYWVKLVRSGNTFTGYVAPSGGTWRLVGSATVPMGSSVFVGLAVCSHNIAALTTATADSVTVTRGSIVSPTASITSPASGASFGAPATVPITASATPGTGATVKQVDFYAGSTLIGTATQSPYSVTWSNVAAGSYSLTAVVTDSLGNKGTSTAVGITVTTLPAAWGTTDVGSVGVAGSASYANGTFTLRGAGADIWGDADGFRFVYKAMTGDGQITARVTSLQNTNGYAKSGVMIRESLAAGSKHVLMDITPVYGAEFLRRTTTDGSTIASGRSGLAAPYWVRLVRSGSTFTGYVSSNGTTWSHVASTTIAMNSTVYVGLVVTSHNSSVLCTATIDNVQ